jgi:hypothetical protein
VCVCNYELQFYYFDGGGVGGESICFHLCYTMRQNAKLLLRQTAAKLEKKWRGP